MAKRAEATTVKKNTAANIGDEAKLWQMADALRDNMAAAEYKHVVLGLTLLKYISGAFEAKHAELDAQLKKDADPKDPDEHRAAGIFWFVNTGVREHFDSMSHAAHADQVAHAPLESVTPGVRLIASLAVVAKGLIPGRVTQYQAAA
jgi:hypothetical protein